MICARCGTPRQPIGPRHSLDGWGRACLRYACHGCGYAWTEPAPDEERADQIVRLPVQQQPREAVAAKPANSLQAERRNIGSPASPPAVPAASAARSGAAA